MRFPRSRKSYVLISFGFVIALFLFTHWRSYKILVQNNYDRHSIRVQNNEVESLQINEKSRKINEQTCLTENGYQASAYCTKTGVLGVAPTDLENYRPNPMGLFACLSGNVSISWISVNDDFCDCPDGSDEPGTGACPSTRFYCAGEERYLPSSRINDGICDCCDGSDEWKKQTVREDVLRKHNFDINYVPCESSC